MLARGFDCAQCAAAPHLTRLQGCWQPTTHTLAVYGGEEFRRCPVTYQVARAVLLVRSVFAGETRWGNAKAWSAWSYVQQLDEEKKAELKREAEERRASASANNNAP